jgi:hypothetical protein
MHTSSRRRPLRVALTSTLLCGALLVTGGAAAHADDRDDHRDRDRDRHRSSVPQPGERRELVSGLVGPLSLSVGKDRTVYVSQDLAYEAGKVERGRYRTLVSGAEGEIEHAGVSSQGRTLYYVTTDLPDEEGSTEPAATALWERDKRGKVRQLADLGTYEVDHNPDAGVTYGFTDLPEGCEVPDGYPFRYTGIVESHPYATEPWRDSVYVADAAGNDILRVDKRGRVHTVAVLPPVPAVVTAEIAAEVQFPECTIGATYLLEPVPTDVEVGKDGWLYVSSLPGGPESPSMPALGSVFKVHPRSGKVQQVATGFLSATNLAIGDRGEIYVTELFANRVSVIPRGSSTPQPFLTDVTMPAAVEVEDRALYLTTDALPGPEGPNGKVVKVELRRR